MTHKEAIEFFNSFLVDGTVTMSPETRSALEGVVKYVAQVFDEHTAIVDAREEARELRAQNEQLKVVAEAKS